MNKYIDKDMAIEVSRAVWRVTGDAQVAKVTVQLEELPSADVKEVRHGKWIEENDTVIHGHCSSCGWNAIWQESDVFGMSYCPNCGAKMDEEENIPIEYYENGGI